MSTTLYDNTSVDHEDAICTLDSAQSVCDCDGCSALCCLVKRGLDNLLGFGVKGRGRFVKEKNLRVPQKGTGNGDTLFLTTR